MSGVTISRVSEKYHVLFTIHDSMLTCHVQPTTKQVLCRRTQKKFRTLLNGMTTIKKIKHVEGAKKIDFLYC